MKKRVLLFLICVTSFVCLFWVKSLIQERLTNSDALKGPDLEEVKVSYRGEALKKLSFGYDNVLASLIWVRLLQEAKYTPVKNDSVSWEYSEVDAVTTLDPNFDTAYRFGSIYISFLRRDKLGGKKILEKWVKHAPNLWKSHHMLGMHYFLELGDYASAAPHILRASQLPGAPPYIASLGIGLLGQSGASLFSLQTACELFEASTHPEARARLANRVRGLRWHLEKNRWEVALQEYKKRHGNRLPSAIDQIEPYLNSESLRNIASAIPEIEKSESLRILFSEKFEFALSQNGKAIEAVNRQLAKDFENIGVHLPKDSK